MEEILSIVFLIVFGIISIISKIVTAQKKQKNFASQAPIKPKPMKPTLKAVQKKSLATAAAGKPVQLAKPQPRAMANKKALIPEDETPEAPPPVETAVSEPKSPIDNFIMETEIGTNKDFFADKVKANKKFAILCHEVLGKPKALTKEGF